MVGEALNAAMPDNPVNVLAILVDVERNAQNAAGNARKVVDALVGSHTATTAAQLSIDYRKVEFAMDREQLIVAAREHVAAADDNLAKITAVIRKVAGVATAEALAAGVGLSVVGRTEGTEVASREAANQATAIGGSLAAAQERTLAVISPGS
jgi:hypothetical protein